MKLERYSLGAVYRLEFSMVELEALKKEPPHQGGKPISEFLLELVKVAKELEENPKINNTKQHYQNDPDWENQ